MLRSKRETFTSLILGHSTRMMRWRLETGDAATTKFTIKCIQTLIYFTLNVVIQTPMG